MPKNVKVIKIQPNLRGPIERQVLLRDMGENTKLTFFNYFTLNYIFYFRKTKSSLKI